jgi:EamA domain-containing membrane protein RarD
MNAISALVPVSPVRKFLNGAFVYDKPFTMRSLASFASIWVGVVLFCVDLWRRERASR